MFNDPIPFPIIAIANSKSSSRPRISRILAHPPSLIRTANRIYRRENQLHVHPISNPVARHHIWIYFIITSTRHWIPNANVCLLLFSFRQIPSFSCATWNRGNASVRVQFRFLIHRANRIYVVPKSRVNFRHLRIGRAEQARGNIGIYRSIYANHRSPTRSRTSHGAGIAAPSEKRGGLIKLRRFSIMPATLRPERHN